MPVSSEDLLADDTFLNFCFNRNPVDVEHWTKAIQADPQFATQAKEAQKLIAGVQFAVDQANAPIAFRAFRATLNHKIKPLWQRPWLAAAAIAAVAVGMWWAVVPVQQRNPIAFIQAQWAAPKQWKTNDNRTQLTLPDGSKVTLGYNTTLTLAKDFNQNDRQLELNGEAFFEVAKNAQKPFVVQSKHLRTQALGTAFLVEAYEHQTGVKVWLTEGKVKVSDTKATTTLTSGQKASTLLEGQISKDNFDKNEVTDWKSEKLLFDKTSFDKVLVQLSVHYGVQFKVSKMPASPLSFTGDLSNQSLEESLEIIGAVNHFSFELIDNQPVVITFE